MLRSKQIFYSKSDPVPPVRNDIQIIPIEDNGKKLLFFHDTMGYLSKNFALDVNVQPLLKMLTGEFSVDQIHKKIEENLTTESLLDFVQLLDQHRVLNSEYFHFYSNKIEEEFESSEIRQPALTGESYPDNPEDVQTFVSEMLSETNRGNDKKINALYAPHIEISVGQKQYGEAFSFLKNIEPKRVVVLATSHYSDYYHQYYEGVGFIGSKKIFNLPGRMLSPDIDLLNSLNENSPENGFTLQDRAHRIEHSIEFHLLFASAIWQHDFKIVPILISGFDELFYYETGDLSKKIDRFTAQLKTLIDENTFVLISGDLSHVGQKFGDRETANELRVKVERSDKQFLNICGTGNPNRLLDHLKKDYDASRICGFPPLYTYLKMFPDRGGELINYFWWDEKERNSAVSFGTMLF